MVSLCISWIKWVTVMPVGIKRFPQGNRTAWSACPSRSISKASALLKLLSPTINRPPDAPLNSRRGS